MFSRIQKVSLYVLGFFAVFGVIGAFIMIIQNTNTIPTTPNVILDERFAAMDMDGRLSILVSRNRHEIYERHFPVGRNDRDQPYFLGAMADAFTALAVMKLKDQGLLEFDDSIGKFLPKTASVFHRISVRDLLMHQSGLSPDWDALDPEQPPLSDPGLRSQYAKVNYLLLSQIIAAVVQEPAHVFIDREVIQPLKSDDVDPLKITNTYYQNDPEKGPVGWYATASDMLAFEIALNSNRVAKMKTMLDAFTTAKLPDDTRGEFGFAWLIDGVRGLRRERLSAWDQNHAITRYSQKVYSVVIMSEMGMERFDALEFSEEVAYLYLSREMRKPAEKTGE